MITETSISYYGLNYVEHAEADFKEMKAHGGGSHLLRPNADMGGSHLLRPNADMGKL